MARTTRFIVAAALAFAGTGCTAGPPEPIAETVRCLGDQCSVRDDVVAQVPADSQTWWEAENERIVAAERASEASRDAGGNGFCYGLTDAGCINKQERHEAWEETRNSYYDRGYHDEGYDQCIGDCHDMDGDGRTHDDLDADGDGRYESR